MQIQPEIKSAKNLNIKNEEEYLIKRYVYNHIQIKMEYVL